MDAVKLEPIRPFNKFGCKSCYYHHLVSCYGYLGVGAEAILGNQMGFYRFHKQAGPSVYTHDLLSPAELEAETGVREVCMKPPKNLVKELIASLRAGKPVILAVDTYYLPYREDLYKKLHVMHYILVYGYNAARKTFICMEHMFANSLRYSEKEISFRTLTTAHKRYMEFLHKDNPRVFVTVERCKAEKKKTGSSRRALLKRIASSQKAAEQIEAYMVQAAQSLNQKQTDNIINFFNNSLPARHRQLFALEMIGAPKKECLAYARAIDDIRLIRGLFYRTRYTGGLPPETLLKMLEKIQTVFRLEKELHGYMRERVEANGTAH